MLQALDKVLCFRIRITCLHSLRRVICNLRRSRVNPRLYTRRQKTDVLRYFARQIALWLARFVGVPEMPAYPAAELEIVQAEADPVFLVHHL